MEKYFDPKVWRPISGFKKYVCTQDGRVMNRETGNILAKCFINRHRTKRTGKCIGAKGYILRASDVCNNQKRSNISVTSCIRLAWPDLDISKIVLDGVEYRQCYPGNDWYYISKDGILINHRYNDRRLKTRTRKDGAVVARITLDGMNRTVNVSKLFNTVWNAL